MTKAELIAQLALYPDNATVYAIDYESGRNVPLVHVLAADDPGPDATEAYLSFDPESWRD
jgi:hypothetical protein